MADSIYYFSHDLARKKVTKKNWSRAFLYVYYYFFYIKN
nr:MAG TPA: hypothetical protein [Caudoviricetes sp.]